MSQLEVDKVIPQSGTTLTLGESGDTVSVPSGATLDASNATLTLPDDSVTTAKIDDGAVTNAKVDASAAIAYSKLNLATSIVNADISTTAAIATTKLGAGAVLQVVSTAKTDTFTTSSLSYTDVTGLSVSITPSSASNKILILAKVSVGINTGTNRAGILLKRDSTDIFKGDVAGSRTYASSAVRSSDSADIEDVSIVFLDSPATTSSTTYKIQCTVVISGSIFINRSNTDTDNSNFFRTASSITVMEIAG